ncbi:hypothetical protein [Kribbella sp. NPDC049227]|uniref:hypothetical protein n=1 Tax=Kribbella sp. NPDC049227 TaxID=3364113 RepID=UPI0037243184
MTISTCLLSRSTRQLGALEREWFQTTPAPPLTRELRAGTRELRAGTRELRAGTRELRAGTRELRLAETDATWVHQ